MNLAQTISTLSFFPYLIQARGGRGWCCSLGLSIALVAHFASQVLADWPQILGPQRNGRVTSDEPLATRWPAELSINWRAKIGSGFGGSAIVSEQVLTMHRTGNKESLIAHSLIDGTQQWECDWPATYQGRINPDEGPRCVPVVEGEFAFCYGAAGDLACVRIADGKLVWLRNLRSELKADDGYFGAGSTPLAINGMIIVCLGGKGAGIVAVEQETGKTRWTATEHDASYASPIAIQASALTSNASESPNSESPLVLVVTRYDTVLLDPESGKVLSSVQFGSRGPTVNAATPVLLGNHQIYLTASYGVGALTLSIKDRATLIEVSRNQSLSSQYNTPVLIGTKLIGIDGREDVGVASLKAIDDSTQKTLWEVANFGTAHLIGVNAHVLALKLDGALSLIDGSANRFSELATAELPAGVYRALPAYSSKKLVLRRTTTAQQSELLCIELP